MHIYLRWFGIHPFNDWGLNHDPMRKFDGYICNQSTFLKNRCQLVNALAENLL